MGHKNRGHHIFIINGIIVHLVVIMDDLSTIFYIIVAIVYVIYSAIKRGKPKELPKNGPGSPIPGEFDDVTQESPSGDSQRRPTFEDLLREFTQPQPVPERGITEELDEPEEPYRSEGVAVEEKKAASIYDAYQNVEIGGDDIFKGPRLFAPEEEYEEEETNKLASEIRDMLKSPDGLKKTILLNEIIRPKYF